MRLLLAPAFAALAAMPAAATPDGAGAIEGCARPAGGEVCARLLDLGQASAPDPRLADGAAPGGSGAAGSVLSLPAARSGALGSAFPSPPPVAAQSVPAAGAIPEARPHAAVTPPQPVVVATLLLVLASALLTLAAVMRRRRT